MENHIDNHDDHALSLYPGAAEVRDILTPLYEERGLGNIVYTYALTQKLKSWCHEADFPQMLAKAEAQAASEAEETEAPVSECGDEKCGYDLCNLRDVLEEGGYSILEALDLILTEAIRDEGRKRAKRIVAARMEGLAAELRDQK
jgi:hypothetical protein